jgi:hypothetical protein
MSARSWHRPLGLLCHQCGQAFQVRTTRQAAHPFEVQCWRDAALCVVARRRTRVVASPSHCRARSHSPLQLDGSVGRADRGMRSHLEDSERHTACIRSAICTNGSSAPTNGGRSMGNSTCTDALEVVASRSTSALRLPGELRASRKTFCTSAACADSLVENPAATGTTTPGYPPKNGRETLLRWTNSRDL